MLYTTPTMALLERAIDVSALRQSVHAANIANAGVDGYARLAVSFDAEVERASLQTASGLSANGAPAFETTAVVATGEAVKLDEEMAAMAKNSLRYQILLNAFERSLGSVRLAINEGRS
jgi:flagellar basal-body rod protein FlgB